MDLTRKKFEIQKSSEALSVEKWGKGKGNDIF